MKKEWNSDPIYGDLPFKTIKKLELKIVGLNSRDDAAFLQYQLLVKPEILRCHIEFLTKHGSLLYNPLDSTAEKIVKAFPEPFKAEIVSEQEMPYKDLVAANYHLK